MICKGFPIQMTWILLRAPRTSSQDLRGVAHTNDLGLLMAPHTTSNDLQGVSHTNHLDFAKGSSYKQLRIPNGF